MNTDLIIKYIAVLMASGFVFCGLQINGQTGAHKTQAEADEAIRTAGSTSPEWWDSVELNYPETLDLSWPVRQGIQGPGGGGRGRGARGAGSGTASPTNVDDYLTQVIYPNPPRYKAGIRLVHHLMILHKDDSDKLRRSLNMLGDMFYQLLGDYARAAFWWQKYAQMGGSVDPLKMARCYHELGSKAAAEALLASLDSNAARNNRDLVKLWARIGEVDKALALIESGFDGQSGGRGVARGLSQSDKYLLSAGILRAAGRYDEAIVLYEKVLALPDSAMQPVRRNATDGKDKARMNIATIQHLKTLDIKRIPDGSYTAVVNAYGGPMTVKADIKQGRLVSVDILRNSETFSYLIMALPTTREIVARQGFEGVHAVTGATVTAEAIIHGTAKALSDGMK